MPDYLILAKSYVQSSMEGDVWEGIDPAPIAFHAAPGYRPSTRAPVSLELGGPWAFYTKFQEAHGLTSAMTFLKPQTALSSTRSLWVPLLLHNDTDQARDITLHSSLPKDWTPTAKDVIYRVEAHETYPAQLFLTAPAEREGEKNASPQRLAWSISEGGKDAGVVALEVSLEYNGVPQ